MTARGIVRKTRRATGMVALLVALVTAGCVDEDRSAPTASEGPSGPASPSIERTPTPAPTGATLGITVFSNGRILEFDDGRERVVAEWPSLNAPYHAPVQTPYGFVGLARRAAGDGALDLVLVRGDKHRLIERDVAQGFAVSDGANNVAYSALSANGRRSRMVVMGMPQRELIGSVRIDGYAEPVGFVGEKVLMTSGDGHAVASLWDPASGNIEHLHDYGSEGATHPTARRALVYQGDGLCWEIASWSDTFDSVQGPTCSLTSPAFSPDGRWIAGVEGQDFGVRNTLRVFDVYEAKPYFRSVPITGAFQLAWEDEATILVVARRKWGPSTLHRCDVDSANRSCRLVWKSESKGRYSNWVVPRFFRSTQLARDEGTGFTMWPEHRGKDAVDACGGRYAWRTGARRTAARFAAAVLDWPDARVVIDRYEQDGVHALVHRGDGPFVETWLTPVARWCWSVAGVSRPSDRRPTGVSVSVRGRRVIAAVLPLGAESGEVIVGFNGRTVREDVGPEAIARVRLPFKPKGSGFFLILLKDESGRVFSAAGALVYPGLSAG